MNKLFATTAIVLATGLAAPAMAQTYGSLGYANVDVGPYDLDAVDGRFGWKPGPIGVEAEAKLGVGDDTVGLNTAELNHELGVFGIVEGQFNPSFSVFGRAGYAAAEVETNGVESDGDGLAYGGGVVWSPGGGPNGVRAEYTNYEFDAADSDVWSIGLQRRF